jgi:multimeric flavodoxin WrbA
MKIVVLNGSPKGEYSITLQYVKYLEKVYTYHDFSVLHVSQKIKKLEKDLEYFNEFIGEVESADIILWSFGLWVLAVPAQYMRFVELITERKSVSAFAGKYTAAVSTSIQFYDHTAHNYMRAVCEDLGMRFVEGISFYMLDFMKEKKRKDLHVFFDNLFRTCNQKMSTSSLFPPLRFNGFSYLPDKASGGITTDKKVLVLTDDYDPGSNLGKMIDRFAGSFREKPEIIDLKSIEIKGGCLGCMKCGYDYNCQYKDGFAEFYNEKVRKADILVFAGEMKGRYLSSTWKTFFDRAYFWNHTPSLLRKQIAYIISGPISQNPNLMQILEGNVTARQSANLVDIVSDESEDSATVNSLIEKLARQAVYYAGEDFVRPQNFLGVGGHKIFRDEIFGHIRSVWQADHRYYRKNGLYDFEQKKIGLRILNLFLLLACRIPSFRKKYYDNIRKFIASRYENLTEKLTRQESLAPE